MICGKYHCVAAPHKSIISETFIVARTVSTCQIPLSLSLSLPFLRVHARARARVCVCVCVCVCARARACYVSAGKVAVGEGGAGREKG